MGAPSPRPHDLKLLERLVGRAAVYAKKPAGDHMAVARASEAAIKAVLPVGHQGRESVFVKLIFGAQRLPRQTPAERVLAAEQLGAWAVECRTILEAGPSAASPPQRRLRADIDG
jgi:hypothetical protein